MTGEGAAGAHEIVAEALVVEGDGPLDLRLPLDGITRIDGRNAGAMLRVLAGLVPPDAGLVVPAVGAVVVPERPALFIGTLLDNLTGWDASRTEAARAVAASLGLTALTDRLPEGLLTRLTGTITEEVSAGVAKRVALGRALVLGAGPLLLEYPEADLDADGRRRLAAVLRGRDGVVLVTDDPGLAALASHRVTVPAPTVMQGVAA